MGSWYDTFELTTIIISAVSVLCGMLVVIMALVLYWIKPSLRHVPSIYLSLYIGFADALYRMMALLASWSDFMRSNQDDETWLRICFWSVYFAPVWFVFLTAMITLDLQLTFLHPGVPREPFQRYYLPLATVIPLVISLPALLVPHIRWLPEPSRFGFSFGTSIRNKLFGIFCYDLWISLGIAYCLIVVILVIVKLVRGIHYIEAVHLTSRPSGGGLTTGCQLTHLNATAPAEATPTTTVTTSAHTLSQCSAAYCDGHHHSTAHSRPAQLVKTLRQSAIRIMLYPIVPLVCQTLQIVSYRVIIDHHRVLHFMATVLCSSQGVLNFIVFLLNPVVGEVFHHWLFKRRLQRQEQMAYGQKPGELDMACS
ncbi:hypothetical protein H4R35_001240 [Dimargaris xerosporica]|nr:hypothetical protein H4R35_001240 [Dimargaris xerosporica]